MIFKLQMPLAQTGGGAAPVLAYDQSRRHTFTLPVTPALAALFDGAVKVYAECQIVRRDLVVLHSVSPQDW